MATEIKKYIDVVTQSVNITAASGVTPAIVAEGQATRSGELLTPALASVAPVQTASVVTADSVTMDGIIELDIANADTPIAPVMPFACKIVDAWLYKSAVAGGAAGTIAIADGATTLFTFTTAGLSAFTRLEPVANADTWLAAAEIPAGSAITVTPTKGAGNVACKMFIRVKRTA